MTACSGASRGAREGEPKEGESPREREGEPDGSGGHVASSRRVGEGQAGMEELASSTTRVQACSCSYWQGVEDGCAPGGMGRQVAWPGGLLL